MTLPVLASWTDNGDAGVKYFSGTATYTRTVNVPVEWSANGARVLLDLGSVKNVADVRMNGRAVYRPVFSVPCSSCVSRRSRTAGGLAR